MDFFKGFEKQAERRRGEQGRYMSGQMRVDPDMAAAGAGLSGAGLAYGGHRLARRGAGLSGRAQAAAQKAVSLRDTSVRRAKLDRADMMDRLSRQEKRVTRAKNPWQWITGKRAPGTDRALAGLDEARSRVRRTAADKQLAAKRTMQSRLGKIAPAAQKGRTLSMAGKGIRGLGAGALLGAGLYGYDKLRKG